MKKIVLSEKEYTIGKIVCVGRNYAAHAKEFNNEIPEFPIIFLKPPSSLIFSGDEIIHPDENSELHHEVELVLIIGKTIKNANDDEASNSIAGYGVGLDMTLRDVQSKLKSKGHPWTLAKCFDNSAVVSDFVSTKGITITGDEEIKLFVNDELKQNGKTDQMIFNIIEIVKFISSKMTLEEGDLVFTGTPAGVGAVNKGDRINAEISKIGKLETKIK